MCVTCSILVLVATFQEQIVASQKGSQAVLTEPFDLAAGGTSLTRASQEGILFANPALLTLGDAKIRWIGSQIGLLASSNLTGPASLPVGGSASQGQEEKSSVVDKVLNEPYKIGQSSTFSFLSKYWGIAAFTVASIDIEGNKFADGGLPAISLGGSVYAGSIMSFASAVSRWLRLGISFKYLLASEPYYLIPIADPERFTSVISDPVSFSQTLSYGQGLGIDGGALFFFQGPTVDWSLAIKADDINGTKLGENLILKPTYHVGLGLSIHGSDDVLHLSADYRDVLGAYQERLFKRVHLGARLLFRQTLGLALGYYHGNPSYGIRLNLWLIKLGITRYTEEMGAYPGEKKRDLYHAYLGFGF